MYASVCVRVNKRQLFILYWFKISFNFGFADKVALNRSRENEIAADAVLVVRLVVDDSINSFCGPVAVLGFENPLYSII